MFYTYAHYKPNGEIFYIGKGQGNRAKEMRRKNPLWKKVVEEFFPNKGNLPIEVTESNDNRSYHINSDKIKNFLGFSPKYSVEDAVRGLCEAFQQGKIPNSFDDTKYFNVRTMKLIGVK